MRILVLGGTQFLGRHVVDVAVEHGHDVTLFNRGQTRPELFPGVEKLQGDRDGKLDALKGRDWDAVVDTSGYVPRVVRASAELLSPRVGRYLFVSSISVFSDTSRPGVNERDPVGTLEEPNTEEVGKFYGPLKAACERVVSEVYGYRALNVRPGLIVGPYDPTDRFSYWVARFVHPSLLGDRPGDALVPNPPTRPLQFIDARDLAAFMLELLDKGLEGTHNATSPAGQWTMRSLIDALVAAGNRAASAKWIEESLLVENKVEPWTGLPLWIPESFGDEAGFMLIDCTKAERAGLRTRPLEETIRDTAQWLAARDNASAWKDAMRADVERKILDEAR